MSKIKIEFTKFTLVGILNFALTFVIFLLLLKSFNLNYLFALTITWIIGIIFSYSLNFLWVFKPEEKIQFKDRAAKYFFAGLMSFALNLFTLKYIVEHTGFDPFYVQGVLIPVIVFLNFLTSKFWSLRPVVQ